MSVAYYRRWFWKYLAVSYLCSFAAGWLLITHSWRRGVPLAIIGLLMALAAGRQGVLATRERNTL